MSAWSPDELDRIGAAEELEISSLRRDGSLRPFITIWAVRVDDELYVRSAYGPANGWFARAVRSGHGRIRAGVERDVTFERPDASVDGAVDEAYRTKYASHPPRIVATVVGPEAARNTLRVTPR